MRNWVAAAGVAAAIVGCASPRPEPGAVINGRVVVAPAASPLRPAPERVAVWLETENPPPTLPPAPPSASVTIGGDGLFVPALSSASVGGTVLVYNASQRPWILAATTGGRRREQGTVVPGGWVSLPLTEPGPVEIVAVAGEDRAQTVVFAAPGPYVQTVAADGVYRFEAVPPGRCVVRGWAPGYAGRVPADGASELAPLPDEPYRLDLLVSPVRP